MTDLEPEQASIASEPDESASWKDELFRWRYFVSILLGLSLIGWYLFQPSIPWGLVLVAALALCVAVTVGVLIGFPIALKRAQPPAQRALVELDPREKGVRFRVHYLDAEDSVTVRWGDLQPLEGTAVPAWMCLCYRPETGDAWGTQRTVLPPDELEQTLHQLDEYYGDLEEEATQKRVLENTMRTAARRYADAIVAEQDRLLEETVLPGDASALDVLDEILPDRDEPERGDRDDDSDEIPDWVLSMDELEEPPQLPAATDGGTDETV